MRQSFVAFFMSLWAVSAAAHPHVFIDVGLHFITSPEGALTGVEVTWTYDDFHTLLLLEDRGLDPDGDAQLTEAERASLIGFDLEDWPEWFGGGLFMYQDDREIRLGHPKALSLDVQDGQLVTRHARAIQPVMPDTVVVRAYDPSYFAAISMGPTVRLPEGCTSNLLKADPDEAAKEAAALIGDGGEAAFEDVAIGILFADTLVMQCAPS